MTFAPENKPGYSLRLFIGLSFAAFAIIFFIFSGLRSGLNRLVAGTDSDPDQNSRIKFEQADPLLTKIPGLADVLDRPVISSADPMLGNPAAAITLVEFSDFTCEFCRTQEKTLLSILKAYPDQIRLVWKDYPDGAADSVSRQTAIAGRCAAAQGKFWPMHDLLFDEKKLDYDSILGLAKKLDLNGGDFKKCLVDEKIKKIIDDNIEEANALDIKGVPFIFVNEKGFLGEVGLEELKQAVENEMNKL